MASTPKWSFSIMLKMVGKTFFHAMLPPMTQVQNELTACKTAPSFILFCKVGRWFYVFQSCISVKRVNFLQNGHFGTMCSSSGMGIDTPEPNDL